MSALPPKCGVVDNSDWAETVYMKTKEPKQLIPNALMMMAFIALGLLCLSLFQAQVDPILERGYGLFTICTTGLLALHHSLRH